MVVVTFCGHDGLRQVCGPFAAIALADGRLTVMEPDGTATELATEDEQGWWQVCGLEGLLWSGFRVEAVTGD